MPAEGGPFWTQPSWAAPPDVDLTVHGHALPAGSKRAVPIRNKAGEQTATRVLEDSRQVRDWKRTIGEAAQAAGAARAQRDLLMGALAVELHFTRPRPAAQFGTGRNSGKLKERSPAYPVTRPDVLKLARAVEDALTGVVWRDDSLIVDERIVKVYAPGESCRILVWQLPVTVADLRDAQRRRAALERFTFDTEPASAVVGES